MILRREQEKACASKTSWKKKPPWVFVYNIVVNVIVPLKNERLAVSHVCVL